MKLHEAPTPMQKIIADAIREFKKRGQCKARLRTVLDGEITSRDVSELMEPGHKEFVERMMIARAREGALTIALVSEVWTVDPEKMLSNRAYARATLLLAEEQMMSVHPDRIERLMVTYETAEFGILAMTDIRRKPDRLGRWELNCVSYVAERKDGDLETSGRFNHIYEKARQ